MHTVYLCLCVCVCTVYVCVCVCTVYVCVCVCTVYVCVCVCTVYVCVCVCTVYVCVSYCVGSHVLFFSLFSEMICHYTETLLCHRVSPHKVLISLDYGIFILI